MTALQQHIRTHDCEPTLTDFDVLDFCRLGYLMLEKVVPDEVNERTCEFLDAGRSTEELLDEDWFVDNVIINPTAAGAIRSLLGRDFKLTMPFIFNHIATEPMPAQDWHRDGSSRYGPELDSLQVFYYPQDTPNELGPTDILPGSHFLYGGFREMSHYRNLKGVVSTASPAGTIFLTVYSVWHRRSLSTMAGIRHLVKYWYTRTTTPTRDWITESEFELEHAYHNTSPSEDQRDTHRALDDAAEMFYWLAGEHDSCKAWSNNLPVYYYTGSESCRQCGLGVATGEQRMRGRVIE